MINATIKNQQHVRRFAKYLEDKTNEFYTNEIDRELLNKAKEKIINIHEKNIELN